MKILSQRISAFFCSILLFIALAMSAFPVVNAAGSNLLPNSSVEDGTTTPTSWIKNKWGTNTSTFAYNTTGRTGGKSITVKTTSYTSGDAKWYVAPVAVSPGTSHTYTDWYKSNVATVVTLAYTSTSNTVTYQYLGSIPASTDWKQTSFTFTTPTNAAKVSVFHLLNRVGQLTTDDHSLVNNAENPTTPPSVPTVRVSAPAAGSSVSNSIVLSANASDAQAVTSVQFKVDGANVGTADTSSPYSVDWDTKQVANGSHNITAVATNTSNLSTTSSPITITVANTAAPTAPTVSVTTPTTGSTVSNTTTLAANASDAQAIASVQFKIDGATVGTPDTSSPYSISWDSKSVGDGSHTVTAVATNASNLTTTSTPVTITVSNPITPPAADNLIANSSFEAGTTAPASWTGNGWGANTHSLTYESTGRTGSRSAKAMITSYSSGDAKWMANSVPVTANTTYKYSNWYKSDVETELDAMVTMSNGTVQYYYLTSAPASPNDWTQVNTQFTAPTGAASMVIFQVIAKVGYVQTDDHSLTAYTPAKFSRGLVSITFDDGWRNIATNGLPLLQKYNLPSTQYVNSEPIMGSYPDYMTYQMIKDFKAQGSELAWHTRSHVNVTTLTTNELGIELSIPSAFLTGTGQPAAEYKNFATPFGAYNATSVNEIKKYYRSHRSTDVGYNSKDAFNLYNIKVQNILNTTTPTEVQGWVNQAISTNTWLVLVYHEVTSTAADPTYAVTPANLDAELNIVKQSGVTVKTVDQALDEILPQL